MFRLILMLCTLLLLVAGLVSWVVLWDRGNQSVESLNVPSEAKQADWYSTLALWMYSENNADNTVSIAELLNAAHSQYSFTDIPDSAKACKQTQEVSVEYANDNAHPAKIARLQNKTKQMFILQITALRQCVLNYAEYQTLFTDSNNLAFQSTFFNLLNRYESFKQGDFSLYEAEAQDKLLAYSIIYQNQRIFIAFNFSYDIHEMPMPFGFMSSTKVTFWQSDVDNTQTFVTSSPLMIRPFTAAIVIVE